MGSLVQAWFVTLALLVLGGFTLAQALPVGGDRAAVRCGDQIMRVDQFCHIVSSGGGGHRISYAEQRSAQRAGHGRSLVQAVLGGVMVLVGGGLAASLVLVTSRGRRNEGAPARFHGRALRQHR